MTISSICKELRNILMLTEEEINMEEINNMEITEYRGLNGHPSVEPDNNNEDNRNYILYP